MTSLDKVKSGELAGVTTATIMHTTSCNLVKFKALASNVGNVYIGGLDNDTGAAAVTTPKANTNRTTGLELQPGDDSGWLPVSNLNKLSYICDTVNDRLSYIALL